MFARFGHSISNPVVALLDQRWQSVCDSNLLVSYLFQRHRDATLGLLTGFMVGSLAKLWPWQQTLSYQLKPDGSQVPLVQEPVSPAYYQQITGDDPAIGIAIASAVTGIVLVVALNWVAGRFRERTR